MLLVDSVHNQFFKANRWLLNKNASIELIPCCSMSALSQETCSSFLCLCGVPVICFLTLFCVKQLSVKTLTTAEGSAVLNVVNRYLLMFWNN